MTHLLAAVWPLIRRRLSGLLVLLAFVGVPTGVVLLTGGLSTLGFWIQAVLTIPLVAIGVMPLAAVLFIPAAILLAPVMFVLRKLLPRLADVITENGPALLFTLFGIGAYVLGSDLDPPGGRLPFSGRWLGAGALLTMTFAFLAASGLLRLSVRLQVPGPNPRVTTPAPVGVPDPWPDEPEEEYWDVDPVVGWRAWRWDGWSLSGMFVEWTSEELRATCQSGHVAPKWDHSCGIYAFKDPSDARSALSGAAVAGRVEMSGSVIEHEAGYRCSHARITHLWATTAMIAQAVQLRYPNVSVSVGSPTLSRKD